MDAETPHVVTLPRAIVDEMLTHVQASYPNEGCGFLASVNGQIVKNYRVSNAAERPDDFSIISPEDSIAIYNEIDRNDWDFFAYYHSHTQTEAYPSPRDIKHSHDWPGSYYIIFSLRDWEHPQVRIFTLNKDRNVIEHEVKIEP